LLLKQDKKGPRRKSIMADHSLFLNLTPPATQAPLPPIAAAATAQTATQPPPPGARASPIEIDAPPKRARFDPSVDPGKSNCSPLSVAEDHITAHISSLHEGIATLLLNRGREHLVLSQRLFSKERSKIRIEKDDDYIPVSARVKFQLQVVNEAEELPEYLLLQNKTADIVKRHQEELKVCVVDSIKLDIKAIRAARNRHYCISMHAVSSLFHIAQGLDVEHSHHTVVALLNGYSEALLKHTGLPANEFLGLYTTTLDVPAIDPNVQEQHPTTRIGEIKRAIESVFVLSWDKFLATVRENQLSISLKKEAKATLLAAKTEDATMEIDNEIPADRAQLQELIRKEALKLHKSMIKEEVSNQLRSKNGTGGPSSASQKKKIPGRNQGNSSDSKSQTKDPDQSSRTRQRAKQRGRKAAARNNDSQSDKAKKRGSRSKSRSTKKKTGSDNRNSRS
jgi:hypothetical protein